VDLRSVGDALLELRPRRNPARSPLRQCIDECDAAELRSLSWSDAARFVTTDRRATCKQYRSRVDPASIFMIVTPVSSSPLSIARWIGAAPRHRGSNDA
jgi:hypothetical protein